MMQQWRDPATAARAGFDCDNWMKVRNCNNLQEFQMTFTHPLARTSCVASTAGLKGNIVPILVIITGLQLEQHHPKYKVTQIKRLSDAARSWLEDHPDEADDFILINRPKKWLGDKD